MCLGTVRTFAVIASDLWPLNRAFLWRVSWTLLGSFAGPVCWWFALNRRNQWRLFYAVARRRLHSCLLNRSIHNQQGPASPAVRTRQCSQRMAHWTRDGSEGVQPQFCASVWTAVFFVLPRLFFVAWFLASQAVTASGSGNPAPLGSKTFCVPQKNQRPVRCIELNPFCSRFGTFKWFWPSSASRFARHSVRSDGGRAPTSGESS